MRGAAMIKLHKSWRANARSKDFGTVNNPYWPCTQSHTPCRSASVFELAVTTLIHGDYSSLTGPP